MEEEIDFEQAAKDGDLQAVKRFVASHPNDLNQQLDLFGLTAFNAACKGGQVEVVTYLLGIKGVNYNTPSSTGETPFFNACASKNAYKLVPLLIRANKEIDITTKNNKGMTPLSVAVEKMDLTTVEWILANDKNVDLDVELDTGLKHVGLIGFTAIKSESTANESTRVGAMKGKKSVYSNINKLLVEYKSDRKTTMDKLREELKIEEKKKESKEEKRLQLLENLFDGEPGEDEPIVKEEKEEEKQGEDSEEENEEEEEQGEGSDEEEESEEKGKEGQQQQQPQEKPEEKKPEEKKEETKPDMSVAMMRSLINEDIFHINKQDGDGNTPLMIACQKGQTEIVQLLLDQGDLKPDLVNNKGETALFLACWWNKPLCISALLKRPDVNIDLAPTERDPPIIVVAYNGLLEGVKAFLQSNRDDLKLDKTFWIWKDEKNQKVDLGEFLNHKFHKHNKESAEKHHERTEHYPEIIKLSENYIAAHQTLVEFVLSLVNANE